ncbi:MAG: class I SAM-dependent methyltransferase [Alphaproteobacteria bacterium]
MTPLARRLTARISEHGPLTVAEYMTAALTDPEHGYYTRHDPFGRRGDFVTAPEVTQMFGELLGVWCGNAWQSLGEPQPIRLVELGPGRGTLMADALRALARALPACLAAARVHLVETSPRLRREQAQRLRDIDPEVDWHDSFTDVPPGPLLLVANEFFDALPVRQFEKTEEGWRERLVTVGNEGLCLTLSPTEPGPDALPRGLTGKEPTGTVVEDCPTGRALVRDIAGRIEGHGGAALIIDYGEATEERGDTLQATRRHAFTHVLAEPGDADITAHVRFAALAREAREAGARVHGPETQARFLRRIGIEARAAALFRGANARQRRDIAAAVERLIAPTEMGTLFKALAIVAPEAPAPGGFQ